LRTVEVFQNERWAWPSSSATSAAHGDALLAGWKNGATNLKPTERLPWTRKKDGSGGVGSARQVVHRVCCIDFCWWPSWIFKWCTQLRARTILDLCGFRRLGAWFLRLVDSEGWYFADRPRFGISSKNFFKAEYSLTTFLTIRWMAIYKWRVARRTEFAIVWVAENRTYHQTTAVDKKNILRRAVGHSLLCISLYSCSAYICRGN